MQSENASLTTGTVTGDRGIAENYGSSGTANTGAYQPSLVGHYHSFWGSVFAGSIAAISLSVLSYALMFGCHVGLYNPQGDVNWGVGALIWSVITAAVAYFIGGSVAAALQPVDRHGWVHGFMVWALSVPLVLVLTSMIAIGTSMTYGGAAPAAGGHVRLGFMPTILQLSPGVGWMLFLSMVSGMVFAIFGGLAGGNRDYVSSLGNRLHSHSHGHSHTTSVPPTDQTINVR
ncbi:MAG TPA: hypothetical protein VF669_03905 [Tepidisphaeraceae bacterium]